MPIEKEELDILLSSHLASINVDLSAIRATLESVKSEIEDMKKIVKNVKIDEVTIRTEKQELTLIDSFALRDTSTHISEIVETTKYDVNTIWVRNDLNAEVELKIMGNWTATHLNAAVIKNNLRLAPNESLARNVNIYTSDWLPFIFVEFRALTAPTSGSISAKLIQRKW